jgi:hypothetical protein
MMFKKFLIIICLITVLFTLAGVNASDVNDTVAACEDQNEVTLAENQDNDELKNEIADLFYHVMVLCANQGLDVTEVEAVLEERSHKIGNLKQFHVSDHNT